MDKYDLQMELGSGSFGRVVKARSKQQPELPLAIKMIQMGGLSEKEKNGALNEIRLLASIESPNVIGYHDAFFQNDNQTLCIVMQYANGGDLAGLVKRKREKGQRFNQNFIWQVAYDLLKALNTLHKNKIIHRDLKPGNVFFVDGVAKLGDLNISKVAEGGFASTQAGTPYYTSPQIWSGVLYDSKCDIWSLGCLIYQCASLRPPFLAKDFPSLSKKINQGVFDPIPHCYSTKLSDVVRACLSVSPNDRPSAADLLNNPVFQYMHSSQEGSVNLLSTIRCPRVLKMIQQKLPEGKSTKSNKKIEQMGVSPQHAPFQLKKFISEQKLRHRIVSQRQHPERRISKEKENSSHRDKFLSKIQIRKEQSPLPARNQIMKGMEPQAGQFRHRAMVSPTIYRKIM